MGKKSAGNTLTQREKLARAEMSWMELPEYLQNVSEARRVMGVSRQHFSEYQKSLRRRRYASSQGEVTAETQFQESCGTRD